jgi:Domain of unknown function (DUF5053)
MTKAINIAEVARRWGKSRQWVYQRLNGSIVNGKAAQFTQEELCELADTLQGIIYDLRDDVHGLYILAETMITPPKTPTKMPKAPTEK